MRNFLNKILSIQIVELRFKIILLFSFIYSFNIFLIYYLLNNSRNFIENVILFILILIVIIVILYFGILTFKNYQWGIIFITFLLPFERIGSIYNAIPINIRLSQIFIILTLIAYTVAILRKKEKFYIKKDFSYIIVFFFLLINAISLTYSIYLNRSLEVFIFDTFALISFIFISNITKEKVIFYKIIETLLAISFILGLYGLFQFITGSLSLPLSVSGLRLEYSKTSAFWYIPRVQGTALEPLYWGNFLLIPISLSLSFLLDKLNSNHKLDKYTIFYLITLFILLVNIFLTFSRGAWYSTFLLIIIIFVFNMKKLINKKTLTYLFSFIFIGITIITLIIVITKTPLSIGLFVNRATSLRDQNGRQVNTPMALEFFKQHPITGIGVGGFGEKFQKIIYPNQVISKSNSWAVVSNQYLEILTESGILGLILFLFLLSYISYNVYQSLKKVNDNKDKVILIALIGGFAGIFLQYISFSTLYITYIWVLLGILNGFCYNLNSKS